MSTTRTVALLLAVGALLAWVGTAGAATLTAYYNFDALNTPTTHPSRFDSDTLYVDWGDDPEGVLLRTQTSPVQARYMEQHPPPIYIVSPGRTFRRDTMDATHSPVFHQMEGLAVDENISITTSRDILEAMARGEGPARTLVALGYAGWGPGQLEQEMAANTWLSCPAEEQIIFETPVKDRWQAAADLIGVDLGLISSDTGHA